MASAVKTRGTKVTRVCKCCEVSFEARKADVDRGWAKFCSKRCKAIDQEGGTGQYRRLLREGGGQSNGLSQAESDFQRDMDAASSVHGQDPGDGGW